MTKQSKITLLGKFMKKRITAFILILLCMTSAHAELGLEFNRKGEFVPPDLILQNRAVNSYRDGDINDAMSQFKHSARFGNEYSKYLVASLYFEKKNWIDGYAWLNLLKQPIDKSDALKEKIEASFSKQQIEASANKFASLEKEFNDETSLKRRKKWERSLRSVGTNLRGIDAMLRKNVRLSVSGSQVTAEPTVIRRAVTKYIKEGYHPKS